MIILSTYYFQNTDINVIYNERIYDGLFRGNKGKLLLWIDDSNPRYLSIVNRLIRDTNDST